MNNFVDKNYPHNNDAERALLNILLMDDQKVGEIENIVTEADFYRPAHAQIYKAIKFLNSQKKVPDLIALEDLLRKWEVYDDVGGLAYLVGLQEEALIKTSATQYATMIRDKAKLRTIIDRSARLIQECYKENDAGIASLIDSAEKTFFELSQDKATDSMLQTSIWLTKTFSHLSSLKSYGEGVIGIPSGLTEVDKLLCGFQKGDMVVVGARPSMGKTSFGLTVALKTAQYGHRIGFYSLEMAGEQIMLRLLSMASNIEIAHIKNAMKFQQNFEVITQAAAHLSDLPLFIDSLTSTTLLDLKSNIRRAVRDHKLELVIIDYLGLIRVTHRTESKQMEIAEISYTLKTLAKELNIPIIVLSQLSRGVESRIDKRPMMSDLRDSGAIEQDADVILFLYRDFQYNQEANAYAAEIIVGKHRNGPTGTAHVLFDPPTTRFENI